MKYKKKFLLITILFVFVIVSIFFPYDLFLNYSEGMMVTQDELSLLLEGNPIITASIGSVQADTSDEFDKYIINYKLFNLFNIKRLKVNVIEKDRYFAGGETLGFSLESKGVILVGGNYIITSNGIECPIENSGLKSGDIITHINEFEINDVDDITDVLSKYHGGELDLRVIRDGSEITLKIVPALDKVTGLYKLGLWLKEDAVGIGTLTFVNVTSNRFGSLGHAIVDNDSTNIIDVSGGNIYKGNVIGITKGRNGKAGELIGTFRKDENLGSVDKNCEYGVYGFVDDAEYFTTNKTAIDIGGRLSATPGKATILCSLDGTHIEEFEIEIIKTNFQSSCNEKSMVIRIVDDDLINRTGGIVQGMSGSPIIQNGKLIGAVTHVFVNDSTKGFGIYIDWMLEQ